VREHGEDFAMVRQALNETTKALRPSKKNSLQVRADFVKGLRDADEAPVLDAEGAQLMSRTLAECCEVLPAMEAREVMQVIFTHYLTPDDDDDEENPGAHDAKKATTLPELALTDFCEALRASYMSLKARLAGPDADGARYTSNSLFKIMSTMGEHCPHGERLPK
jgi:hypothetical protein